jgi:hypothetical protein
VGSVYRCTRSAAHAHGRTQLHQPVGERGCEHFGVGYYGTPSAIRYHWLLDDGAGNLVQGPAVNVATPTWTYVAPVPQLNQPAQVVAAIPAPEVPIVAGKEFGEPSWVKVVKTTTHNTNDVPLADLVSDDRDGDGLAEWQNAEPAEVETEWKLLQANNGANGNLAELEGAPDDMGDGDETVTRRYEFYAYAADATTIDGESGEAMCSEVAADGVHGKGTAVEVTDAYGEPYFVNCKAQVVVGDYLGAQMAGFDAAAPLGLVDNLQNGDPGVPYTARTVVVGGNTPYSITVTGSVPQGMELGDYADPATGDTLAGVLSGTPATAGIYDFTVDVTDADGITVSRAYTLGIGAPAAQYLLSATRSGSGRGTIFGSGVDCGLQCSVLLDGGTDVSLNAIPKAGSVFRGWGDACSGLGACAFTLDGDTVVSASFVRIYQLDVARSGAGAGTVTGFGIDCGAICTTQIDAKTAVVLKATAAAGSIFTGWSGACTGTGGCRFRMNANKSATANFAVRRTLKVGNTGPGTVTSSPTGISCGTVCRKGFAEGTSVTLTAVPDSGHVFLGWSGACTGTEPTCTVTLATSRTVGAVFE